MTISLQSPKTAEILSDLGFADPMDAARQQARMILLGRMARYEAEMQLLAARTQSTLAALHKKYETIGAEEVAADDDYVQWHWLDEAAAATRAQLAALEANEL